MARKRSSINFEEPETRIIKRQSSARTLMANKMETSLHLGNASPRVTADQVPSFSPNFEQTQPKESDESFFIDSSQACKPKANIERERCAEPEIDELCLSEDVENEHTSFTCQAVVDDVLIIPESVQEGDDEPDGRMGPDHHHVSTSPVSYVFQDADDAPEIYLNATGDRVTMGIYSDERAKFYLDYYVVLDVPISGQRCVIRNAATNQIYDAVQNNMKTVTDYLMPDATCMLDKIMRNDETFVFESVQNTGHFLITLGASGAVKLSQYPGLYDVPSEGAFHVTVVKESALSSVRV